MRKPAGRDLYRILGVTEDASEQEVKRAYRRTALRSHPDRNSGTSEAEELFKAANDAYSVLGNPAKRKRYDLYREFILLCTRWGIQSGARQDRFLEDFFLQMDLPVMVQDLLASLRHARLSQDQDSSMALPKLSLLLLYRFLQSVRRGVRSRKGLDLFSVPFPLGSLRRAGRQLYVLLKLLQIRMENPAGSGSGTSSGPEAGSPAGGPDIEWPVILTRQEATPGKRLRVSFPQDSGWLRIVLRVPEGVEEGKRIRIRGKGNRISGTDRRGDLYLRISIE